MEFEQCGCQVARLAKEQCKPLPGEEPSLEGRLELIKGRPEQGFSRIFHLAVKHLPAYGLFCLVLGFRICGVS